MLDSFYLKYRCNKTLEYTGMDSLDRCPDQRFFQHYPHEVLYQFNSRGFRDEEWPDNLNDCIWCIGDSFTVGLGSNYNHIWPKVLEKKIGIRCINISMDGASNEWISRKCLELLSEIKPKAIIAMWSFTNRREDPNLTLDDEDRRIWMNKKSTVELDNENFFYCRQRVVDSLGEVPYLDLIIPNHQLFNKLLSLDSMFLGSVQQLDYSRDRYHFDLLTSTEVAKKIIKNLSL